MTSLNETIIEDMDISEGNFGINLSIVYMYIRFGRDSMSLVLEEDKSKIIEGKSVAIFSAVLARTRFY